MKRFDVIKRSKFDTLSDSQMSSVKGGGICLKCMKRARYDKRHRRFAGWELNSAESEVEDPETEGEL